MVQHAAVFSRYRARVLAWPGCAPRPRAMPARTRCSPKLPRRPRVPKSRRSPASIPTCRMPTISSADSSTVSSFTMDMGCTRLRSRSPACTPIRFCRRLISASAHAAGHQVRLSPTIADALTLGTGKLAVDAVLLIAEHGEYPYNEKLQKLYPRGKFFREVLEVIRASGSPVPVFIDKHLSYSRSEASEMVAQAKALKIPLMAGSSLPVTWRFPALEIPLDRTFKDVLVASRGDLEIYGFHALETLQCMVERRKRNGKPQGVAAVTCLEGDAVWEAGDRGVWSWTLLEHALGRSHSRNVGDIKQNTRDYMPPNPPGRDQQTKFRQPVAFVVEYVDGLRATVLILNGHVDDTTFAAKISDSKGGDTIVSTLTYLPAPPGACFFDPLVLRIEDFFRTRTAPYPVERTLLTGGILDVALESRIRDHRRIETPELAAIDYRRPQIPASSELH